MILHWRYATIVIPAKTEVADARNYEPTTWPFSVTVRAKLRVDRKNEPLSGSAWTFIRGPYAYYLPMAAAGIAISDERFVKGGRR